MSTTRRGCHRETVELLIARGANLEIRDEQFDSTPEGWAEEGGHAEIVKLLRGRLCTKSS